MEEANLASNSSIAAMASSKASSATSIPIASSQALDKISWLPHPPDFDDRRNHWQDDKPKSNWCLGFEFPTDPCNWCESHSSPVGCTHRLYLLGLLDIASFISQNHRSYTLHADNCYRYSSLILKLACKSVTTAQQVNWPEPITERPPVQGTFHQVFPSVALSEEEVNSLSSEYMEHKAQYGEQASYLYCSISKVTNKLKFCFLVIP